jgi:hypothetical protein
MVTVRNVLEANSSGIGANSGTPGVTPQADLARLYLRISAIRARQYSR